VEKRERGVIDFICATLFGESATFDPVKITIQVGARRYIHGHHKEVKGDHKAIIVGNGRLKGYVLPVCGNSSRSYSRYLH